MKRATTYLPFLPAQAGSCFSRARGFSPVANDVSQSRNTTSA